jgi:hypothetical protein
MAATHGALLCAASDGRLKQSFRELLWRRGLPRQLPQPPLPQSVFLSPGFSSESAGGISGGGSVAPPFGNTLHGDGFRDRSGARFAGASPGSDYVGSHNANGCSW